MGKVVGIDLGTTNSVVAVLEGGKPVVIANAEGMRTTPSVVAFTKDGERLVGQMARRQAVLNPQNTFYNVKRFIGRKYAELNPESKRVPYTILRDELNGNIKIKCPRLQKDFAPEELSAMVLRKLVEEASRYLGEPVTKAVITVPAYFNDAQRQATRDAGRIAGLEVLRILNEPTAASLAYGLDRRDNETILVFDLGGGTFDVSILDIGDGVFEVKATSGDSQLGGSDFDRRIVDWLAEQFQDKHGIDLRRDRQSLQRLMEAAEKAKIELSGVTSTEINLPFIAASEDEPLHLETRLTRTQFEELCGDLVQRMRQPVRQAFSDSGLSPNRIDEVVLVGGGSRMPMVKDLIRSIIDRELNETVNPDEVVAVGAAIQGAILNQEVQDILLLDVTPLSLGLETVGGLMKKLIPRNTTIPVRRSDVFSTSENNQTMVEIHVVQGEREMATDNKSLGRFKLMGIPPAPRGIPQIAVSLDIDANGILQVTAVDRTTGREQGITIQGASNLSDSEVDRMIEEAERFADEDRQKRDRIEKRTKAEALTFEAERQLREVALDFGMQFASAYRRRIESLIQELRDNLKRNDDRGIDITQADLRDALYELQREVYQLTREDEEEKDFFGSIRRTLSNLGEEFFGDDDDFYDDRRDYGRSYGSDYGRDTYAQDSWSRPDYDRNYNQNYGRDRYAQNDWTNDRDYNRDTYSRDSYGRDNYSRDTYSRDNYGQDSYSRDNNSRDDYNRDTSGRDSRNRYSRDPYNQDSYSRRDSGSGTYSDDRGDEYRGRSDRRDSARDPYGDSYTDNATRRNSGNSQGDYPSSSERRNSYRDENSDPRGLASESASTPRRPDYNAARSDDPWNDSPRNDSPRNESPRNDSPRNDSPRNESARNNGPRSDSPRNDSLRNDSLRNDSPRTPRSDSSRDPEAAPRRRSSEGYGEEPAPRRSRDAYAEEPSSRRSDREFDRESYPDQPSPRRPRTTEGESRNARSEADYDQPRSIRSDPNADPRSSGSRRIPMSERPNDRRSAPPSSYNNGLDDEWGDEDEWL